MCRPEPGRPRADRHFQLALEDVEAVGVRAVEVQRRAVARVEHRLEERQVGEPALDKVEALVTQRFALAGA